ncbi:MAG: flavin reductase [Chromatiales bacterium]|nr:flavin reductase [Chromatiales bacterium]
MAKLPENVLSLHPGEAIWERFYSVFPLTIVGTRELDGAIDLAPKHLAIPFSWEDHFGFVCSPEHGTYKNVRRNAQFTVSYPRPNQVMLASLAASPRCDDHKPALANLATFPAQRVDGELVKDAYLYLECELDRVIDRLGPNSVIIGRIVAAHAHQDILKETPTGEPGVPLLAYLYPGRYAEIRESFPFPFPKDFKR